MTDEKIEKPKEPQQKEGDDTNAKTENILPTATEQPDEELTEEPEKTKENPIQEAKKVLAGITEQNKIMAENIKKAEKLAAENLLGGSTLAGQPEKSEEEKSIEAAKRLVAGTGLNPFA